LHTKYPGFLQGIAGPAKPFGQHMEVNFPFSQEIFRFQLVLAHILLTHQFRDIMIHLRLKRNKKDMDDSVFVLKALADETRFRMIHLLLTHDLCVGALADHLSLSKAAVSQHLQILRKAGLVKGEKRGYWTHYGVNRGAIHEIADMLKETADHAPESRVACHRNIEEERKTANLERRTFPMCQNCCEHPTQLKDKPENCTPEQIKECHGDEKDHPCARKARIHTDK